MGSASWGRRRVVADTDLVFVVCKGGWDMSRFERALYYGRTGRHTLVVDRPMTPTLGWGHMIVAVVKQMTADTGASCMTSSADLLADSWRGGTIVDLRTDPSMFAAPRRIVGPSISKPETAILPPARPTLALVSFAARSNSWAAR